MKSQSLKNFVHFLVFSMYFKPSQTYYAVPKVPEDPNLNIDDSHLFPKYPFQQYIQVRRSYSEEHLPAYLGIEYDSEEETDYHDENPSETISSQTVRKRNDYYPKRRKSAEILDHKLQEVYEEKGFSDIGYDHLNSDYDIENHEEIDSPSFQYQQPDFIKEAESSKLLKFVSTRMYDKDSHRNGIYASRSFFYCPPMVNLKMEEEGVAGNNNRHPNGQRLSGLGSRISCMKNKYFGKNPLPPALFLQPAESQHSKIEIPTFDDFYREFKQEFGDSDWQFK